MATHFTSIVLRFSFWPGPPRHHRSQLPFPLRPSPAPFRLAPSSHKPKQRFCGRIKLPPRSKNTTYFLSTLVRFALFATTALATPSPPFHLPLSTTTSHITDAAGARVKLSCVSWAGHMEANIPEGLHRASVSSIALLIKSSGFNCVRLTSSTWLWTRGDDDHQHSSSSTTIVSHHFQTLNLTFALAGIHRFNPEFLQAPLRVVHDRVVATLASHGLLLLLDNHVSKPQWCCGEHDGNGFWGDKHFDPDEWVRGLAAVARRFRGVKNVVAMSLRNELRGGGGGDGAAGREWVKYMTKAAAAVHSANPEVLVVAGGLSYSSDFSFLEAGDEEHVAGAAPGKLVLEFHWYKWFARGNEFGDPGNGEVCERVVEEKVNGKAHAKQKGKVPYILSEFGVKQEGDLNYGDGRFLDCAIEYLKESQEAWGLWALQGSYYLRNGAHDFEETFGVLDAKWQAIRNPVLMARLRPIQG